MRELDSVLLYFLKQDAEMIRDTKAKIKEIKKDYKKEKAAELALKEINSIKSKRENFKKTINDLIDSQIKNTKETQTKKYCSLEHQGLISNTIKLLELANFNINADDFKMLIAPMQGDRLTLNLLNKILVSKDKLELSNCCEELAKNDDAEATEKMLNAIKEYVDTDVLKAVGGEPTKFRNSSYEELCCLAENLDFDIEKMKVDRINHEDFLARQINMGFDNDVEPPFFNIKDEEENYVEELTNMMINNETNDEIDSEVKNIADEMM